MAISNPFFRIEILEIWLEFHWNIFLRIIEIRCITVQYPSLWWRCYDWTRTKTLSTSHQMYTRFCFALFCLYYKVMVSHVGHVGHSPIYLWYTSVVLCQSHDYSDVIMGVMASQITGVSIVCSAVCSGADQRKHQSSASLAFVRGIHRWPVDSPHKGLVTRKMFPFNDVIVASELSRKKTDEIERTHHNKTHKIFSLYSVRRPSSCTIKSVENSYKKTT